MYAYMPPDAGTDPGAVVVEVKHAVVALAAVRDPGGPVYVARAAELELVRGAAEAEVVEHRENERLPVLVHRAVLGARARPAREDAGVGGCCRPQ